MPNTSPPQPHDATETLLGKVSEPARVVAPHQASAPSPAMAMIIGQARNPEHVVAPIAKSSHGLGQEDLDTLMRQIQETTPIDASPHIAGTAPVTPVQ